MNKFGHHIYDKYWRCGYGHWVKHDEAKVGKLGGLLCPVHSAVLRLKPKNGGAVSPRRMACCVVHKDTRKEK